MSGSLRSTVQALCRFGNKTDHRVGVQLGNLLDRVRLERNTVGAKGTWHSLEITRLYRMSLAGCLLPSDQDLEVMDNRSRRARERRAKQGHLYTSSTIQDPATFLYGDEVLPIGEWTVRLTERQRLAILFSASGIASKFLPATILGQLYDKGLLDTRNGRVTFYAMRHLGVMDWFKPRRYWDE